MNNLLLCIFKLNQTNIGALPVEHGFRSRMQKSYSHTHEVTYKRAIVFLLFNMPSKMRLISIKLNLVHF